MKKFLLLILFIATFTSCTEPKIQLRAKAAESNREIVVVDSPKVDLPKKK